MPTRFVGVIGFGGLGREILPEMQRRLGQSRDEAFEISYVVEDQFFPPSADRNIIRFSEFIRMPAAFFVVGIADGLTRRRLHNTCLQRGFIPLDCLSPLSLLSDDLTHEPGLIAAPFAHVSVNTKIGCSFHLNYYACVAHDCVIGDFVTFGPKAQCNGHVIVGDGVYVGAGALIRNGSKVSPMYIGENSVIGMGAVVLNSLPAGSVVAGNPAKPIKNRDK